MTGRRVVLLCNRGAGRWAAQAFLKGRDKRRGTGGWTLVGLVLDDRGRSGSALPQFAKNAERQGVPVLREAAINSPEAVARLSRLSPDLFAVLGFSQRLGKQVLRLPAQGVLNVHTSLLPSHRGATPTYWMVREGVTEAGVTVHWMAEEMDSGAIVAQLRSPVGPDETGKELETRLAQLGAGLLVDLLGQPAFPAGRPQTDKGASSHPPFRAMHAVLDLDASATAILAQVRAARGWIEPTVRRGDAHSLDLRAVRSARLAAPGDAAAEGPDRLVVERPDGTVVLELGPGEGAPPIDERQTGTGSGTGSRWGRLGHWLARRRRARERP